MSVERSPTSSASRPTGEIVLDKTPTHARRPVDRRDERPRAARRALRRSRSPSSAAQLDILVHGTTTADNTMIEMNGAPPACSSPRATATRSSCAAATRKRSGTRPTRPDPDRAPAGPHPDPRAHGLHAATSCSPLDEEAVRRGVQRLKQLGVRSIAVMYLFSFVNPEHERRAARDRPRGVPRRRAHLALARGDAARPGVRAGVDHARERVRRAAHRALHVAPRRTKLRRAGLRRPAADHAVDRRRDAARLRRPPRGHAARVGPDRRRDGRDARRRTAPTPATSSRSTWAARASTSASCATAGREIKTDWNWRYRYYIGLPMVDVQSVGAGGGSIARVRQGALLVGPEIGGLDARARSATAAAARCRPSPTPTPCSATSPPTVRGRPHAPRRRRGRDRDPQPRRRAARSRRRPKPRGASSASSTPTWRTRPARCSPATAPTRATSRSSRTAATARCTRARSPRELGVDRIVVPKAAPAFSALGVLVADYVVDLVRSYVTPLSQVDLGRVRALMSELDGEVAKELEPPASTRPRRSTHASTRRCVTRARTST